MTNHTMLKTTSIVGLFIIKSTLDVELTLCPASTGTASSRRERTGRTAPPSSTSARSPAGTRSCTTSKSLISPVSTVVPGSVTSNGSSYAGSAGTYWYHSHLSTQYCDGLRGPFVVYDPNDPLLSLYDVDDGEIPRHSPCQSEFHSLIGFL